MSAVNVFAYNVYLQPFYHTLALPSLPAGYSSLGVYLETSVAVARVWSNT